MHSRSAASCSATRLGDVPPGLSRAAIASEGRRRSKALARGDPRGDLLVGVAERQSRAHEGLGDVGRDRQAVAGRLGRALWVEAQRGHEQGRRLEGSGERVDLAEQRAPCPPAGRCRRPAEAP